MSTVLAQGTTAQGLQAAAALESSLPEQTPVALTLRFAARPPGFDSAASAMQSVMTRAGVTGAVVVADSFSPTLQVSWLKASVGLPTIIAVLAGGAAFAALASTLELDPFIIAAVLVLAAVLLVGWIFSSVGSTIASIWPKAKPYVVIGSIAAATLYAVAEIANVLPYQLSIRQHTEGAHNRYRAEGERQKGDR